MERETEQAICEVHGSWYDPSNPVVKYSGSLKDAECEWMERETLHADLVLVMGTSLGGLFADQVATECATRSRRRVPRCGHHQLAADGGGRQDGTQILGQV